MARLRENYKMDLIQLIEINKGMDMTSEIETLQKELKQLNAKLDKLLNSTLPDDCIKYAKLSCDKITLCIEIMKLKLLS